MPCYKLNAEFVKFQTILLCKFEMLFKCTLYTSSPATKSTKLTHLQGRTAGEAQVIAAR